MASMATTNELTRCYHSLRKYYGDPVSDGEVLPLAGYTHLPKTVDYQQRRKVPNRYGKKMPNLVEQDRHDCEAQDSGGLSSLDQADEKTADQFYLHFAASTGLRYYFQVLSLPAVTDHW